MAAEAPAHRRIPTGTCAGRSLQTAWHSPGLSTQDLTSCQELCLAPTRHCTGFSPAANQGQAIIAKVNNILSSTCSFANPGQYACISQPTCPVGLPGQIPQWWELGQILQQNQACSFKKYTHPLPVHMSFAPTLFLIIRTVLPLFMHLKSNDFLRCNQDHFFLGCT